MSVLDSLDFQPVLITELFVPHKGRRLIAAHRRDGSTPFVGGSESNNSVTGFSDVDPLFPGGWLTLVYNGSVGHTRFQPAPFFASDDVIVLEPRGSEPSTTALLMCAAIIQRECVNKYSYGSKLNLQRLNRQTIMVPVLADEHGNQIVDWGGLDRLGAELLDPVIARAHGAVRTHPADDDTLPELRFEPMNVVSAGGREGLFIAHKGKRLIAAHRKPGSVPFVGAAKTNNGIVSFSETETLFPGGWVTLVYNGDGATGHAKYQPVPFNASDDVIALEPVSSEASEDALLLLACLLTEQCVSKFSFGYKLTLHRLARQKIMVPATTGEEGQSVVDWEGMTRYGRALRVRVEQFMEPVMEVD